MALRKVFGILLSAAVLTAPVPAEPAEGAAVADFYADRVVSLYIGYPAGGGYDVYGRLVANHIGRFLPGNPTVIPVNMEGAGSLRLANWLYNAAPRDGSALGIVNHGVPFEPLLGNADFAQFDPIEFTWIGSTNDETVVCVAWHSANIASLDDLYAEEFIIGGTGPGADDFVFPKLLSGVLDVPLRFVTGYAGGNDINFAMERGEVEGRCGWTWSSVKSTRQYWLDDGSITVFLQLGLRRHADLPDVPLIMDFAEDEEERQMLRLIMMRNVLGRPFIAPPNLPPERAEALRDAFDTMVADPAFLADAARSRLEILPASGESLRELMLEAYANPPELIERTRAILR